MSLCPIPFLVLLLALRLYLFPSLALYLKCASGAHDEHIWLDQLAQACRSCFHTSGHMTNQNSVFACGDECNCKFDSNETLALNTAKRNLSGKNAYSVKDKAEHEITSNVRMTK